MRFASTILFDAHAAREITPRLYFIRRLLTMAWESICVARFLRLSLNEYMKAKTTRPRFKTIKWPCHQASAVPEAVPVPLDGALATLPLATANMLSKYKLYVSDGRGFVWRLWNMALQPYAWTGPFHVSKYESFYPPVIDTACVMWTQAIRAQSLTPAKSPFLQANYTRWNRG